MDEIQVVAGAVNTIRMQQTYTKRFTCKYDLKSFPFDTQKCEIMLAVDEIDIEGINLKVGKAETEATPDLTEYFMTDEPKSPTMTYEDEKRKGVSMQINFKRRLINEAMTTFLPSLLLCILSYITTFFRQKYFNTSITVNPTIMLTITTLLISVMKKLAPTSYLKLIECWLIFAQLIPFTQVVMITLLDRIREYQDESENGKQPENTKMAWLSEDNEVSMAYHFGNLKLWNYFRNCLETSRKMLEVGVL